MCSLLGFGLLLFCLSAPLAVYCLTLILKVSIPITEGLDVLAMLTDDATIAT